MQEYRAKWTRVNESKSGPRNRELMNRTGIIFMWACISVFGVAVFFNATHLSRRYNAWTTTFRKRRRGINQPPAERARELNEAMMSWLFRISGAYFVVISFLALINRDSILARLIAGGLKDFAHNSCSCLSDLREKLASKFWFAFHILAAHRTIFLEFAGERIRLPEL